MTKLLPPKIRKQLKLRRMIIPDKGHTLLECDLSGADAQVVAWDCKDELLKDRFKKGAKIHLENARDLWGPEKIKDDWPDTNEREYWAIKTAVHGTNYGAAPRTVAISVGWTIDFAEKFRFNWFKLHPQIKEWHEHTNHLLMTTRTITNVFGYTRTFFGRNDFTNALAWKPQSTVAIVCTRGGKKVHRYLPYVTILNQIHDSLVMQVPNHRFTPKLRDELSIVLSNPVPYDDPLTIPWGFEYSPTSWGDMKKWPK